ncbi:MAG: hypothetical protein ACK5MN_09670 [Lachnospiraceae bacterium]
MRDFLPFTVSVGNGSRYEIIATAIACGNDLTIAVCGGTLHHVGAISTAYWEGSHLRLHTYGIPAHRDHLVAEMFAARFARHFHNHTAVSAGIHIDDTVKTEIELLLHNSQDCCELLLSALAADV